MVRLIVVLTASEREAPRLVEALHSLMISTRLEAACLECTVWTEADSTVHYFEEWATEPDMRRRVLSDRFTSLLTVMEASREPPDVRFEFLTSTRGLDYVAEIRQGHEM